MKKILLASSLMLAALTSFASGSIIAGTSQPGTRFPIYAPEPSHPYVQIHGNSAIGQPSGTTVYGGSLLSGTRYVMEFWAGPESATDFSGLTLIHSTTFRSAPATPEALPNGLVYGEQKFVLDVLPGERAQLAMRAWDTESGPDFDSALVRGQGNLFLSAPLGGNPATGGIPLISPNWVGESFSLAVIPEPSSLALAGLGAATLLIFRRRK
ncbi:MAG: PEP-CTERM sorting domain-containing protein [Verrucomicrobiota bacterium]